MPNSNTNSDTDTFTFRIDSGLKAAFVKLAAQFDKPAAEILRDFIRELVETRRRTDFAREAHRQSKIVAAAASETGSDEADVLRQLDQAFDEYSRRRDWK